MPRAANSFYHDDSGLGSAIGLSLGRALFGDPELAAKQALQKAQMDNYGANAEESRAHAGLYGEQTRGLTTQNAASAGLPDLFARLFAASHQAPPPAPVDHPEGFNPADPLAPTPAGPAGAPAFDPQAFQAGLPAVIAALAQAQGDKVDTNKVVGTLGAMFGNDEFARRGMVAQGSTPGKEFALTPERADDIASQGYGADYRKGTDVARINHATDIPIANIHDATTRRGQDIQAETSRRGQDVRGGGSGGTVALDGFNPGGINDGAFARSQPGYAGPNGRYAAFKDLASGEAAQAALLRNYIRGGYDTPQKIADRWAPANDGNDPVAYAQTIASALGMGVNDKLTPNDVARFQQAQGRAENAAYRPKKGGKSAAPKQMSAASQKLLDGELKNQLEGRNWNLTPGARAQLRSQAVQRFQQSGNPVDAVTGVLKNVETNIARQQSKGKGTSQASASGPPMKGARQAPDGKWYVKRGGQYYRVDG